MKTAETDVYGAGNDMTVRVGDEAHARKFAEDGGEGASRAEEAKLDLERREKEMARQRQELTTFITQLKAKQLNGENLVTFPSDYSRMVEKMILSRRSEYKCIEGWTGPRCYEDLPVYEFERGNGDPNIAAGLRKIRALDEELHDKAIEAVLVERETFPEKWAKMEDRRLKRDSERITKALRQEMSLTIITV
eukprot:evm.model.scf_688.8 EVM.evm.TU.scf_688.8   scf_688:46668-47562(-)